MFARMRDPPDDDEEALLLRSSRIRTEETSDCTWLLRMSLSVGAALVFVVILALMSPGKISWPTIPRNIILF